MTTTFGYCGRFSATPVSGAGTAASRWLRWERPFPTLDLSACPGFVVVAAHPHDETLGLGGMIADLTCAGVHVTLVSVSDGAAANPSLPKIERRRLETARRFELDKAAKTLGVNATIRLGLPNGEIADHQAWLANELSTILAVQPAGVWCAATWRGDGHPDHEAVGRAALLATRRTAAAVLLEYPIWMWHWAIPEDTVVPWKRAHSVPLTPSAAEYKRRAAQCFHSQFSAPEYGPTALPHYVLRRLLAVPEVVFL